MDKAEKERLELRFVTCQKMLAKSKSDMVFWSAELRHVVECLASDKQYSFEQLFNNEGISNGKC